MKKFISILGSTGSIGTQVIEVIRQHPGRFAIVALTAGGNVRLLKEQIKQTHPSLVSVKEAGDAAAVREWCRTRKIKTEVREGNEGLIAAATHPKAELLLTSVVGAVGLVPVIAAIRAGKNVALANKEALVVAGPLLMKEARKHGVTILPVDSEHSAVFQCLKNESLRAVRRIILTASGGPFYRSAKAPCDISVEDALDHPTWRMGKKITIDSATLMNKGLEVIEAGYLFDMPLDRIDVLIHPQSIVHSMVEYMDGAVIAQLSSPDMRLPIQYALTYPDRYPCAVKPLRLEEISRLEFGLPDFGRFPCLGLALKAGRTGGTMPAVMNAANEVAVHAFLNRRVTFDAIPTVIKSIMRCHRTIAAPELDDILAADTWARTSADSAIEKVERKLNDSRIRH